MYKLIRNLIMIAAVFFLFSLGVLISDKQELQNNIVRFHVIGSSDSVADQEIKLSVRDALLECLQENMQTADSAHEAKLFIQNLIPQLETVANNILKTHGSKDTASVSLVREKFDIRQYDTFTLPSGIYDSLKVEIGESAGKNWWCVVFPSLCIPATSEGFSDVAASAGFNDGLISTLSSDDSYKVRFYFLDCFGKIENFFTIGKY